MSQKAIAPGPGAVISADLSERERAFVRAYVERGGRHGAGAAAVLAAGITTNRAAARVRASELLHNPRVLGFLRDELTRKLNAGAVIGVQTLIDLCRNAKSEQVRYSAASSLVDRGHMPVMSRNASIVANTSVEELLRRLDAGELPAEGADADIIDATPARPRGAADDEGF
jgi:hypothetical protein